MVKILDTRLVKISEIIIDQGINPRSVTRQDKVAEYIDRLSYSQAPAVKVAPMGDGRYLLIDGNHRLQAYQKTNADEILADILNVDGMDTLRMDILALSFNLDHGLCVEPEMLRNKARFYSTMGLSIKEIIGIIKRPERTIRHWTEDARKEKKDEKAKVIRELEDEGESIRGIANKVGLPKRTVERHLARQKACPVSATIAKTGHAVSTDIKEISKPSLNNDIKQLMDILNSNFIPTLSSFLGMLSGMDLKITAAAKDNTVDKDVLNALLSAIDKNSQSFKLIQELQVKMALTSNSSAKAIDETFDPVKELYKWYKEDLFDTNIIVDLKSCENAIKSIVLQVLPRHNDSKQAIKEIKRVYTYYLGVNAKAFPSMYHRVFIGDRSITTLSKFYVLVKDIMESESNMPIVPDSHFRQMNAH